MSARRKGATAPPVAPAADSGSSGGAGDGESARKRHRGEGAGRESSADQAGDEPVGYEHASESPRQSQPEAGDQQAATTGHLQHLLEFPLDGTGTPRPAQLHPAICRQLHVHALTVSASIRCRAVHGHSGVARALETLATRIRSFKEGEHSPSPPPHLLDKLTDEVLVVASDAVAKVASGASLSGKQQTRLLAWTVADARGAQLALDKPLAETVGKRLERQANRVRSALAEAATVAKEARALALSSCAADPAALEARLDNIITVYTDAREYHEAEVYVGFTELDTLLQPPPSQPPAAEVSAAGQPASGVEVSTQTEQMDHDALRTALIRLPRQIIMGEAHPNLLALLQSALDHIVELECRRESDRAEAASLRAEVISERSRATQAETRAAEAESRTSEAQYQLRQQKEQYEQEAGEHAYELASEGIEVDQLRGRIRGLSYELALLKRAA